MVQTITATRSRKLATIAAGLFLLAAAAAFAAWLISSNGHGSAKVGSLQQPTVSAGTPSGTILPGGTGDGSFLIDNPNDQPLTIIRAEMGEEPGSAGAGTPYTDDQWKQAISCDGSTTGGNSTEPVGFELLNVQTLTGLSVEVPPGESTVIVPELFELNADTPQDCEGATFTRDVKLTFSTATS